MRVARCVDEDQRVPLNIIAPPMMPVGWLESLLPRRLMLGTTADERARLTHTLGLLLFLCAASLFFLTGSLLDPNTPPHISVFNLLCLGCFIGDVLLFLWFARRRWLVPLLVLQSSVMMLGVILTGGEMAFLVWLIAPPMLLMFLGSLRSAYLATVGAVLEALVLGALRERGLLHVVGPSGPFLLLGLDSLAIMTLITGIMPLMLVFESRRRWAAREARLTTRVLLNVKQHTQALLMRFRAQIQRLLDEPELSDGVRDDLREVEASATRLSRVMETLAHMAEQEPSPLEVMGEQRDRTRPRQIRFMLRVSLLLLLVCCAVLPLLLLLKGPSYPLSWVVIAALVLLLPNLVLVRRTNSSRWVVVWIALQLTALCVFGVLFTGDLASATWFSLVPVVLLYVLGARWALIGALLMIVLTAVLSQLLGAGYALDPGAPLSGSEHLDHAGHIGIFMIVGVGLVGYFEQERQRAVSVTLLQSSALATLSHELRTPLNGVLGMLSLAREELPAAQGLSEPFNTAERYGQQLSSLIEDALGLAMLSSGRVLRKSVPFQLRELYEGLQQRAEGLRGEHPAGIHVSCPEDACEALEGEVDRLRDTLGGLLEWACEHRAERAISMCLQLHQAERRHRLEVLLCDSERAAGDSLPTGFAELFARDHRGRDRNALRVALCHARIDFLGGRLEMLKTSQDLLISVPLRLSERRESRTVRDASDAVERC